jgi:nucleoside-diphosphate kinase
MEKTFVNIHPSAVNRQLIGEVISRFEKKGLRLAAMKMTQLSNDILAEHYSHLVDKPFFPRLRAAMQATPVILCCWEGVEAVNVVRVMCGVTNGRQADAGTIRGDLSMSMQENIVHSSDSLESAVVELNRFFNDADYFDYQRAVDAAIYSSDEI